MDEDPIEQIAYDPDMLFELSDKVSEVIARVNSLQEEIKKLKRRK